MLCSKLFGAALNHINYKYYASFVNKNSLFGVFALLKSLF